LENNEIVQGLDSKARIEFEKWGDISDDPEE
jgi:hypothetical protein